MTVQELIDELNTIEDKNLKVVVPNGYRTVNSNVEVVYREIEYSNNYGFQKAMEIILR